MPLPSMLLMPPCLAVGSDHLGCSLPKCRNALSLAAFKYRIQAKFYPSANLACTLTRCRQ